MAAVDMEREGRRSHTVQGVSPANLDYVKRNHDHLTEILKQMAGTDNQVASNGSLALQHLA